jgi:hypothetical protein
LSETVRNGISARLWRLPREFLLALINATAILAIIAAILALLAVELIDNLAGNVVATMTEAVLSKINLPSKDAGESPKPEGRSRHAWQCPQRDRGRRKSNSSI